jgi:hypothetical protein
MAVVELSGNDKTNPPSLVAGHSSAVENLTSCPAAVGVAATRTDGGGGGGAAAGVISVAADDTAAAANQSTYGISKSVVKLEGVR